MFATYFQWQKTSFHTLQAFLYLKTLQCRWYHWESYSRLRTTKLSCWVIKQNDCMMEPKPVEWAKLQSKLLDILLHVDGYTRSAISWTYVTYNWDKIHIPSIYHLQSFIRQSCLWRELTWSCILVTSNRSSYYLNLNLRSFVESQEYWDESDLMVKLCPQMSRWIHQIESTNHT